MNRFTKLATALPLACTVVLVASCDRSAPTDLDPESDLSPSSGIPIVGETLVGAQSDVSSSLVAQVTPPGFTASPYAPDFVVTGSEGGLLNEEHFFPSNANGTFGAKSTIPGLANVDGMDVADMDGDDDNDFLVCEGAIGEVYLYTNDGSGTFSAAIVVTGVAAGSFCTNLREGDFDENGSSDFVVGDAEGTGGMFVYLQTTPGSFTKVLPGLDLAPTGNSATGVAAGDVDGDGHQDVLVLGYLGIRSGEVRFYKGDGTGSMAASTVLFDIGTDFGVTGPVGLALFDLEGDGDLDIVVGGGFHSGTHFVYSNDGAGNFTAPTGSAFNVGGQTGIDAFDFDADGDHDLVVATFVPRTLFYVENLGGTLAAPVFVDALAGKSIAVGAPPLAGALALNVDIDIKPESDPNSINPKSKGVVPVAILGSDAFDATQIDRTTLAFGPDGAATAHKAGGHLENVNGDAYMDLVSHYRQKETGISRGDTEACVTGELVSGVPFAGCDAVRVLSK